MCVMIDNIIVVMYINNMGGSYFVICNFLVREIWFWCIDRNLWFSVVYLLGISNVVVDKVLCVFCD